MRKAILAVLCCAAVALAAVYSPEKAAATPASAPVAGPDVVRQLEHLSSELRRVNGRLADLSAGFQAPPDPDKPAVQAALTDLKAQANETLRLVAELELKLSR